MFKTIVVKCIHCGEKHIIDINYLEHKFYCKKCNKNFIIKDRFINKNKIINFYLKNNNYIEGLKSKNNENLNLTKINCPNCNKKYFIFKHLDNFPQYCWECNSNINIDKILKEQDRIKKEKELLKKEQDKKEKENELIKIKNDNKEYLISFKKYPEIYTYLNGYINFSWFLIIINIITCIILLRFMFFEYFLYCVLSIIFLIFEIAICHYFMFDIKIKTDQYNFNIYAFLDKNK